MPVLFSQVGISSTISRIFLYFLCDSGDQTSFESLEKPEVCRWEREVLPSVSLEAEPVSPAAVSWPGVDTADRGLGQPSACVGLLLGHPWLLRYGRVRAESSRQTERLAQPETLPFGLSPDRLATPAIPAAHFCR